MALGRESALVVLLIARIPPVQFNSILEPPRGLHLWGCGLLCFGDMKYEYRETNRGKLRIPVDVGT